MTRVILNFTTFEIISKASCKLSEEEIAKRNNLNKRKKAKAELKIFTKKRFFLCLIDFRARICSIILD
jgi:hypothetical protein